MHGAYHSTGEGASCCMPSLQPPCAHGQVRCTPATADRTPRCSTPWISRYHLTHARVDLDTLSFRSAVLFSLHQTRASAQLLRLRASSIRLMSEKRSMSTSFCRTAVSYRAALDRTKGPHLNSLLRGDHPSSLFFAVTQAPIDQPSVKSDIGPSRKRRRRGRVSLFDCGGVLESFPNHA